MTELAIPANGDLQVTDETAMLVELYPGFDPTGGSLVDVLAENLGEDNADLRFGDFDKVSVPGQGSTTWVIPDMVEGEVTAKELVGVIILWEASKSYWASKDADGSNPDCSSRDGRTPVPGGLYAEGGENEYLNPPKPAKGRTGLPLLVDGQQVLEHTCEGCPMNQFGSGVNDKGEKTKGKACNDRRLLYMLRPGEVMPTIVALPATSISVLRSFLVKLAGKRIPYHAAEIALGVKVLEGGSGGKQKYGQIVPRVERALTAQERVLTRATAEAFKLMFQRGDLDRQAAPVATDASSEEAATAQADS
jgi:hypothetical protein